MATMFVDAQSRTARVGGRPTTISPPVQKAKGVTAKALYRRLTIPTTSPWSMTLAPLKLHKPSPAKP